jgi:putative mycofactocin binding protein MftB
MDGSENAGAGILDQAWELAPSVALRPEPFGALTYHFGNRRLTFLKRKELVAVVEALGGSPDVRAALAKANVPTAQWDVYAKALRGLAEAGVIRRRDTAGSCHDQQPG